MSSARVWARELARNMVGLWIPPQCPACHVRVCSAGICVDCLSSLVKEAEAFETELDGGGILRAAGRYEGIWRDLVQGYKKSPVSPFPDWLRDRFESLGCEGGADPVLLPTPMHRVRRRERGVNPAEVLAKGLAELLGWPVEGKVFERTRYRRPLRGLPAESRKKEMEGAIRVRPGAAGRLQGKTVWVVDDVLTTGSTVDACFQACAKADISGWGAIVLAWAPLERSEAPEGAENCARNEKECTRK